MKIRYTFGLYWCYCARCRLATDEKCSTPEEARQALRALHDDRSLDPTECLFFWEERKITFLPEQGVREELSFPFRGSVE